MHPTLGSGTCTARTAISLDLLNRGTFAYGGCPAVAVTLEGQVRIPGGLSQVRHLLLGGIELDAVLVDSRHGADRDRHYLAAEHVSLLEHVGDLVAA